MAVWRIKSPAIPLTLVHADKKWNMNSWRLYRLFAKEIHRWPMFSFYQGVVIQKTYIHQDCNCHIVNAISLNGISLRWALELEYSWPRCLTSSGFLKKTGFQRDCDLNAPIIDNIKLLCSWIIHRLSALQADTYSEPMLKFVFSPLSILWQAGIESTMHSTAQQLLW